MSWTYPQYRISANGQNLYRIDGDRAFVELQYIGEKVIRFDIVASTYPELVRIQELLECAGEMCALIEADRFNLALQSLQGR